MTCIGVTCDHETITDSRGAPAPRFFSPAGYVTALAGCGADVLLLPTLAPSRAAPLLDMLDGVVITGGAFDIPPEYYGEEPHPRLGKLMPERSAFEKALLTAALARDRPILCVCGGMQLLNVIHGGSLYQDLSLRPDTGVHEQPEDKRQPFHAIAVNAGSLLAACCTEPEIEVNSTHHQVINTVGDGLHVSGRAEDGVVEAIELPGARFVIGVQWHPEALATGEQLGLFRGLVTAARGTDFRNPRNGPGAP